MSIGYYGHPKALTLLALKPFVWNTEQNKLHPESLPDWDWPQRMTVAQMTCARHHGVPSEDCTCGIHSSLNLAELYPKYNTPLEELTKLDAVPFLGIIQVLGQTLIEGTSVRSKRAYLWGAMLSSDPNKQPRKDIRWLLELSNKYDPVFYDGQDGLEAMIKQLKSSWEYYELLVDKECLRVTI